MPILKIKINNKDIELECGEGEEKLLREVSEEEVEHIRKALDELGPEQLAFQHIFGEKNPRYL